MTTLPYGAWPSPITADLIAGQAVSLMEPAIDGSDIYWIESRPLEAGRYTIMRRTADGNVTECTPPDFYVRTTVHEYGGGSFAVIDGDIYFANFRDQHLYLQHNHAQPKLLTPTDGYRYADFVFDRKRRRLICVREDHTRPGEAVNAIVAVSPDGGDDGQVLLEGNDFYSSPRLSPDGQRLAYLTWNHPNMPWDGCELRVAAFESNGLTRGAQRVAGSNDESIFQPEWSPDGVLHFVGETTGWWNLFRWVDGIIEALCPMNAEFGEPQWNLGMSTYDFVSEGQILCCYSQDGMWHLAAVDTRLKKLTHIPTKYTDISDIVCGEGFAVFRGGSPALPSSIVRMDTKSGALEALQQSFQLAVGLEYISAPEAISFETRDGKQAHAFYYAPKNPQAAAPANQRPPLLVISHGGPTSETGTTLRYSIQYWTSRGFAVLDVNYGGSSGFGRDYRRRLNGRWGIVDVDDCCNAALHLAKQGLADRRRLAIRGGSAGGYTTLACLTFRTDVFAAGASHFGLAELERFATDTHKFESRYLSSLIGPYPERRDLYFERSPLNFADKIACPLILFQGDEDRVVPPSQSSMMFEAVRAKGLPVAYLLFQGEQHGFRKAENIKRSLEAELYFYSKIFGFEPADSIEPVTIENL